MSCNQVRIHSGQDVYTRHAVTLPQFSGHLSKSCNQVHHSGYDVNTRHAVTLPQFSGHLSKSFNQVRLNSGYDVYTRHAVTLPQFSGHLSKSCNQVRLHSGYDVYTCHAVTSFLSTLQDETTTITQGWSYSRERPVWAILKYCKALINLLN